MSSFNHSLKQLLLSVLFILISINLGAHSHFDQKKISLNFKDTPLSEIFKEIEAQTPYKFFYKNEDVNLERKTDIQVNEQYIEVVLKALFKKELNYKIDDNKIILYKRLSNEVAGQIIDAKTNEPISFATVRIKGKDIGVIAGIEGFFRIPIEYRDRGDTLKITSIGYQTKLIPLRVLDEEVLNIITMTESVESLSQVVVRGKKRKTTGGLIDGYYVNDIIRLAIENIPNNYPTEDHSYVGYYRDYQIRDEEYINLNEALVELFDKGFQTNKLQHIQNQMALYSYQPNYEFTRDTSTTIAYNNYEKEYNIKTNQSAFGGNEMSIVNFHDPIRNYQKNTFSFIDVLEKNFLAHHNFIYERQVELDGVKLYQIRFNAKDETTPTGYASEGNIYIEKNNFAIHKLEYLGFRQKEQKGFYNPYNQNNPHAITIKKDEIPFFKINIEYAKKNDKMYLNYISFRNTFDITKANLRARVLSLKYEYLNKYGTLKNALVFEFNEAMDSTTVLKRKNYDLSFYGKKLKIGELEIFDSTKVRAYITSIKTKERLSRIERNNKGFVTDKGFKYTIKDVISHDYDVSKFHAKDFIYSFKDKSLTVEFENKTESDTMINKSMYNIRYENEIYGIDSIELIDQNTVRIYINDGENIFKLKELTQENIQNLTCEIIGVPIKENIYTYERTGEKIEQFREFFVQQINTNKELPNNLRFMDKSLPISKNPVNKIKNNRSYWINTPLKTIKASQ